MSQHRHDPDPSVAVRPAAHWEARYAGEERVWSGRVNPVLAEVAAALNPGRALDLGCGEGADVVWLARRGWVVVGVDIAPTALRRARAAAAAAGLSESGARFVEWDLATYRPDGDFDLVTASYLHSRVDLPRTAILTRAAGWVAPGGRLLITSHARPPWGTDDSDGVDEAFPGPQDELAHLGLGDGWRIELAERRPHEHHHGGAVVAVDDIVILARRR